LTTSTFLVEKPYNPSTIFPSPTAKKIMKTKIALLVTILIATLFGMGCASTDVKTFNASTISTQGENGVYQHKDTNRPVTGRVVAMVGGQLYLDFLVKDGLRDGRYRRWWKTDPPRMEMDAVYEKGELVRLKKYNDDGSAGAHPVWPISDATHALSTPQLLLRGWNQDGTPSEPGKEKPAKK
jgi:hypothetical protein